MQLLLSTDALLKAPFKSLYVSTKSLAYREEYKQANFGQGPEQSMLSSSAYVPGHINNRRHVSHAYCNDNFCHSVLHWGILGALFNATVSPGGRPACDLVHSPKM